MRVAITDDGRGYPAAKIWSLAEVVHITEDLIPLQTQDGWGTGLQATLQLKLGKR